ncbi:hypothetical protein, partial [Xanthomonas phaseoli]|uniref:hypothetical protein n=1 Tax=Xanthomonas phaseoli TaxID=1985254 RepID=UPI001ED95575
KSGGITHDALRVCPTVGQRRYHQPRTLNLAATQGGGTSKSDQFFLNASKRRDVDSDGFFDVIAHGNKNEVEVFTPNGPVAADQRVLAKLIKSDPNYGGQPIRLLSCETGSCDLGFAQNLANKMGVPVKAPTDLVWAYGDGKMVVAPRRSLDRNSPLFNQPNLSRQGEFKIFKQKVQ